MRRKLTFVSIAGLVMFAICAAVYAYIQRGEIELMEHKTARTTTGIVVDKKYVQFRSDQTEYQDDEGQTVPLEDWRKKEGEFRILYRIDNFDQVPEARRSALVTAEEQREKRFGTRFLVVDQRTFEQAKSGQTVKIVYRWANDSKIEIISFDMNAARVP